MDNYKTPAGDSSDSAFAAKLERDEKNERNGKTVLRLSVGITILTVVVHAAVYWLFEQIP